MSRHGPGRDGYAPEGPPCPVCGAPEGEPCQPPCVPSGDELQDMAAQAEQADDALWFAGYDGD